MDDLVATALLGTQRRAPDAAGWPGVLGEAAAAVEGDPAEVLLARAALAAVWVRAGARPAAPVDVAPAPAERLPAAGPAAASRLVGLLEEGAHGLLDEWLAVAAARGLLAPPVALPALLDRGARSVAVRARIRAVAGERGLWLARQRPEWAWLPRLADGVPDPDAGPAPDLSDEAWQLGDGPSRLRWLAAVRGVDPARGLAALATGWAAEPGGGRAALLGALATGLSAADEPFLEAALDDRRKDVRQAAVALLVTLPGSALSARAAARARVAVHPERHFLRTRLAVGLPDELDAAALRDGVVDTPPPRGTAPAAPAVGRRAQWLRQIVAAAPLSAWADLGGPADVLALPVADDWAPVLHHGWAQAAVRERDGAWAEALVAAGADLAGGSSAERLAELAAALDDAARARLAVLVLGRLRDGLRAREVPGSAASQLSSVLAAVDGPWPQAVTDAALGWLAGALRVVAPWPYQGVLDLLAHRLPPSTAARLEALAGPPGADPEDGDAARWSIALHRAVHVLSTRARMLEELS